MDAGVEVEAVAPSDAGQGAGVSATDVGDVGANVAGEVTGDVAGGTANPWNGVRKDEEAVAEGLGVNVADAGVAAGADEAGADEPGVDDAGVDEAGVDEAWVDGATAGESVGLDVADAGVVNSGLAVHSEAARPGIPLTETTTW